jgi:alpha-tubulin suppressor-like RCC1 family protein
MLRRLAALVVALALVGAGIASADFSGAVLNDGSMATMRQAAAWKLALGDRHTCVITSTNQIKCWGDNSFGQLGIGNQPSVGADSSSPVSASSYSDIDAAPLAIAVGASHTCAITTAGAVKCWGRGTRGQLGHGATSALGDAASEMGSSLSNVDLGSGHTATQLALGEEHSCALLDNATVKCWGRNANGQLGIGDSFDRGDQPGEMGNALPAVSFGSATPTAIAAGDFHTCALLDSGHVTCWGLNSSGQLGLGNTTSVGAVAGFAATATVDLGSGRSAVALALGSAHTCVVLDDLSMKCFGNGGNGRLGTGATTSRGDGENELGTFLPAIDLGAARRVWAAAAGGSHTCVLLDDLSMKCFGNGSSGQLGNELADEIGDVVTEMGDNLQSVNLGANVLAIGAGDAHTCALLVTAALKCWGNGTFGALGLDSDLSQGDSSGEMAALVAVAVTPSITTEPGAVRSLVATAGETSVDLSWQVPSATGGSAVSDYVVQYRATSSSTWTTANDGVNTNTSFTVTGLSSGTAYEFRVAARLLRQQRLQQPRRRLQRPRRRLHQQLRRLSPVRVAAARVVVVHHPGQHLPPPQLQHRVSLRRSNSSRALQSP